MTCKITRENKISDLHTIQSLDPGTFFVVNGGNSLYVKTGSVGDGGHFDFKNYIAWESARDDHCATIVDREDIQMEIKFSV